MANQQQLPLVLVDFDKTITIKDTISSLAQVARKHNHSDIPWSFFTDAYLTDYQRHQQTHPSRDFDRLNDWNEYMESFRSVELASLSRVGHYKALSGMTRQDIIAAAQQLSSTLLHPGVLDTLRPVKDNLHIISVNWSKDWIYGFLEPLNLSYLQIHCNELEFDSNGVSTGKILPTILTTNDKKKCMDALQNEPTQRIVYIGDSLGDLLPLVSANVGIVMSNDLSLSRTLEQLGYQLQDGLHGKKNAKTLLHAHSWHEIGASNIMVKDTA